MKTYTEKQVNQMIYKAITFSKIQDAVSISRWSGSASEAAGQILQDANIKKTEIRKCISDKVKKIASVCMN